MPVEVMPGVQIPKRELKFQFSRSGGPGGQNVNKVATRVELLFDVNGSPSLSAERKERICRKLRIATEGILRVASQESRSQWKNRELVVQKFAALLRVALAVRRKRVASKPTKSSRQNRLNQKKAQSEKKRLRSGSTYLDS
mgnify:CR=1 FL=1